MKSNAAPKLSVIDALMAGLTAVARRPALIIVPVVIDLVIWLAPRLSINELVMKAFALWEALVRTAYTPAQVDSMGDMITTVREVIIGFGAGTNLVEAITGNWLGPTSALVAIQSTRQTFISDALLAPIGLSVELPRMAAAPWQGAPIEISSLWAAVLITLGLWLIGQLLVALYFVQCSEPLAFALSQGAPAQSRPGSSEALPAGDAAQADDPSPETTGEPPSAQSSDEPAGVTAASATTDLTTEQRPGRRGVLGLAVRLTAFSLLLALAVMLLRLPLGAALLMTVFSGGGAGILFALVGGITLWALMWLLTSLYFSSEGIVFEAQPIWRGALQSMLMIRGQVLSMFGLVLTINLVLLGFRAVWGLIGKTPLGGAVAILGNGFLTTSMLLAIFIYFGEVRRRWQALQAQAYGSLTRRNQTKDR